MPVCRALRLLPPFISRTNILIFPSHPVFPVMAGIAPEGSQFDPSTYDNKMTELNSDAQEFFTSYDEVYESFDSMGLQENLLRGIYAYGMLSIQVLFLVPLGCTEVYSERLLGA
ncbi:hypothetical protein MLD38_030251 [Melastoma candidum]|uniref:Uncharacterized protein n=1 Tax=Melastoma candidum TaxID=119954 RepID=A0ACB9MMM5_9MYRT|nr:hypothetical protein MLD38_030251 [Melastoma candidum]